MAVRTTADAVKEEMAPGRDYDTDRSPSLTRFIARASALVDRVVTCATAKGYTHTADELEHLEALLAAHFYQQSDQGLASETTDRASAVYHGKTGMYLESTKYGQSAVALDGSGCLLAIGNKRSASAAWIGRAPSEQTDYVDRD